MKKYLLTLAVLLVALFAFGACSSNNDPEPTQATTTAPPAAAATTQTPTQAPGGQITVPDVTAPPEDSLVPDFASMDPIELTIHYIFASQVWQDDWQVWQQIAEHTGVTLVGVADEVNLNAAQAFELAAVEGFPAHIYGGTLMPQMRNFGMQGAFIPLQDLIAEHAPYFNSLMERFPQIRELITAPDGNIYFMPNLNDMFTSFAVGEVYWIRQDWLDMLDLDTPNTYYEFEYVLTRFRDDIPALTGNDWVAPFFSNSVNGGIRQLAPLWGARVQTFGANRVGPSVDDVNTLVHWWLEPEFMVAIQNISRWFQEGLIDPEFFTRGALNRQELFGSNQGGSLHHFPMSTGDFNPIIRATNPDFTIMPMLPPINTRGERWNEPQRGLLAGNAWAITPHNPDPVRTVQMMDFLYHGIGRLLLNFGPYGVTWEFDADGEPVFLPYVTESGEPTLNIVRHRHGAVGAFPYMADLRYELAAGTIYTTIAQRMYYEDRPAGYAPGFWVPHMESFVLSEADQQVVTEINAQLVAFMNETIHGFILNDWNEIEVQWGAFVEQSIRFGAHELVEIFQRAYDDRIARTGLAW